MKKMIGLYYQQDIFDKSDQHWVALPTECYNTIEILLMQALIKAIEAQSVIQKQEEHNASQS